MKKRLLAASALLLAPPLGSVSAAWAQDQGSGTSALDEIVVTAQRREQSLQDVPISIAAFGEESLQRMGVDEIEDLSASVPNLFINNFNGTADTVRLFIRGVGQTDVQVTQDPSVALYIDGVYVGSSFGAGFEAVDLERIEVLRGPQGSLYGRNSTGGAINLISIKPSLDEVSGKAELGLGNYDYRTAKAALNLPIADIAAVRVSGLITKRDAFYENTGPGVDFNSMDRKAARAAVRLQPSTNFTADYAFDYSRVEDVGNLSVPIAGEGNVRIPAGAPVTVPGLGTVVPTLLLDYTDPAPFSDRRPKSARSQRPYLPSKSDVFGHSLTLEWQAADRLTFRSITGYRSVDTQSFTTSLPTNSVSIGLVLQPPGVPGIPAGTVVQVVGGPWSVSTTNASTEYRNLSQEVQALGDTDILGGHLNYVAGLFYYEDEGEQDAPGEAIGGPRAQSLTQIDNRSMAAFTELTYTPGGPDGALHLTVGARYAEDKRKAFRINDSSFSFAALGGFTAADCVRFAQTFAASGQACVPDGAVVGAGYRKSFRNFSPSATIAYDLSDDVNIYTKVTSGYKSGGTSQRSANPANFANGFAPEKVLSFEAGMKGDFFDRRVRLNAAAFYVKIDDYQASVQTGATAGDRDYVGIDGNRIMGIEGDLTVAVTPELRLSGNLGILDTKLGERSLEVLRDTGERSIEQFVSRFSYAPKVSFTTAADFDRELSDNWNVAARVSYSYQSRMQTSTNATDNRPLDARGIVDASLSLRRETVAGLGSLEVRLWAKNLFDEEYRTVAVGSFAGLGATTVAEFGDPRTYGLTLIARY